MGFLLEAFKAFLGFKILELLGLKILEFWGRTSPATKVKKKGRVLGRKILESWEFWKTVPLKKQSPKIGARRYPPQRASIILRSPTTV